MGTELYRLDRARYEEEAVGQRDRRRQEAWRELEPKSSSQ